MRLSASVCGSRLPATAASSLKTWRSDVCCLGRELQHTATVKHERWASQSHSLAVDASDQVRRKVAADIMTDLSGGHLADRQWVLLCLVAPVRSELGCSAQRPSCSRPMHNWMQVHWIETVIQSKPSTSGHEHVTLIFNVTSRSLSHLVLQRRHR